MLDQVAAGFLAGLFAQLGVEGDVATENRLDAPRKLPTIERERTVMPRTTPRLRVMRKPGSSKVVVTSESSKRASEVVGLPLLRGSAMAASVSLPSVESSRARLAVQQSSMARLHNATARCGMVPSP